MNPSQDLVQENSFRSLLRQWPLKWLLSALRKAELSRYEVVDQAGAVYRGGVEKKGVPVLRVRIQRPWGLLKASTGGVMGWAEAYMDGDWQTSCLVDVTDWAMANEQKLTEAFHGTGFSRMVHRIQHLLNHNSRRGSRRNIAAHYDLGNDFYRLWLDPGMSYSSAIYLQPDESLVQAQANKYARVIDWLDLKAGSHSERNVLEVGCGWGGLAEALTNQPRLSYHGITLSKEQLSYAKNRLEHNDRYHFTLTDYRDFDGVYDRIVSIEMIEAVGEAHWPGYFRKISDSLAAGGVAVLQVITIADERFANYRRGVDFIQKYIFPGGMLPSHGAMQKQIAAAGMVLDDSYAFGQDYAKTIQQWQAAFTRNWQAIARQGFDEGFRRMWDFYLAYCQSGFQSGSIDVRLYRIKKP